MKSIIISVWKKVVWQGPGGGGGGGGGDGERGSGGVLAPGPFPHRMGVWAGPHRIGGVIGSGEGPVSPRALSPRWSD